MKATSLLIVALGAIIVSAGFLKVSGASFKKSGTPLGADPIKPDDTKVVIKTIADLVKIAQKILTPVKVDAEAKKAITVTTKSSGSRTMKFNVDFAEKVIGVIGKTFPIIPTEEDAKLIGDALKECKNGSYSKIFDTSSLEKNDNDGFEYTLQVVFAICEDPAKTELTTFHVTKSGTYKPVLVEKIVEVCKKDWWGDIVCKDVKKMIEEPRKVTKDLISKVAIVVQEELVKDLELSLLQ